MATHDGQISSAPQDRHLLKEQKWRQILAGQPAGEAAGGGSAQPAPKADAGSGSQGSRVSPRKPGMSTSGCSCEATIAATRGSG